MRDDLDSFNGLFLPKLGPDAFKAQYVGVDVLRKIYPQLRRLHRKMEAKLLPALERDPIPSLEETPLWREVEGELRAALAEVQQQRKCADIDHWFEVECAVLLVCVNRLCGEFDLPQWPRQRFEERFAKVPIGAGWSERVVRLAIEIVLDVYDYTI